MYHQSMKLYTVIAACMLLSLMLPHAVVAQGQGSTFSGWKAAFTQKALQAGITQATLDNAMAGITPSDKVVALDGKQPETKLNHAQYLDRVIPPSRVQKARAMLRKHAQLLQRVSNQFGVQPEYIVALWAVESDFGARTGDFDVVRSLASLAYDGRREALFTKELINALKIIQAGHITREAMIGSWAGAMGQCQFLPSSFLAYAVDFDGDGRKDIWHTLPDVFASIANYLSSNGWNYDMPVMAYDSNIGKNVMIDDNPHRVTSNFDVILRWNRSNYFASAVGMLAEEMKEEVR